jgi:peptidoglycan/xylan/chitin deacetylase (PgdA/CDA1 family)
MRRAGMEIGGHILAHANLANVDEVTVLTELSESKQAIEDHLGEPVVSLAYPFGIPGHLTERSMEIARRTGYERGMAVVSRKVRDSDQPLSTLGIALKENTLRMLRAKVCGRLDVIGGWKERAARHGSSSVSSRDLA